MDGATIAQAKLAELGEILRAQAARHGGGALRRVQEMFEVYVGARPPAYGHPLQKTQYFLPGLPNVPWHDVHAYPETSALASALESRHEAIQREIESAIASRRELPRYRHGEFGTSLADWKALHMYERGSFREDGRAACPETAEILSGVEDVIRMGATIFSVLEPGGHIPPHHDGANFLMSFHFGVTIPAGCEIRVGTETRPWVEGKCLLFDYSFEHEAWNRSEENRICLIVDVWHPEVTPVERETLQLLTKALAQN